MGLRSQDIEIRNAPNGGVVVIERGGDDLGRVPTLLASFTSPSDMITWLAAQYGLQSHPTAIKRGEIADLPGGKA